MLMIFWSQVHSVSIHSRPAYVFSNNKVISEIIDLAVSKTKSPRSMQFSSLLPSFGSSLTLIREYSECDVSEYGQQTACPSNQQYA